MNEQWIKDLQEKLDGYGKPAPQGLWNDISNAMARQQPRKTVMPLRRKVAMWSAGLVAAAAITLAIVIGDLLPGMFKYDTEKTEQTAAHAKENSGNNKGITPGNYEKRRGLRPAQAGQSRYAGTGRPPRNACRNG